MNLGSITLAALATAVLVSCFTRLNVGVLSLALAWIVGVYLGGMPVREVIAGFPAELFLTLTGITLLFSQATVNGTLEAVAQRAIRLCRGRAGFVPAMFFLAAAALASIGPGNIATAGLLAPVAMATAERMRVSPFLMAIIVGNGANAGSLSPLAPTGIIANSLMGSIGLGGMEAATWLYNLGAHALVAIAGYLLFGGRGLLHRQERIEAEDASPVLTRQHWITIAVIALMVIAAVFGRVSIGMAAFAAAAVLSVLRVSNEEEAIRRMSWSTILMVCGVTVLVALLEKTSGTVLFADFVAAVATPATAIPIVGGLAASVSAYSSTSGVVLPAFLPMTPDLAERLHVSPAALAQTMNVAATLVDLSPLSTIGALCVAPIRNQEASRALFYRLLAWGLSMALIGPLLCWAAWALF